MPAQVRHPTCLCCHQPQSKFFCSSCIHQGQVTLQQTLAPTSLTSTSVSAHRDETNKVARQVNRSVDQASSHFKEKLPLRSLEAWRQLRAEVSRREERCHRLSQRIKAVEAELLNRELSLATFLNVANRQSRQRLGTALSHRYPSPARPSVQPKRCRTSNVNSWTSLVS